jgi:hypothetical protein
MIRLTGDRPVALGDQMTAKIIERAASASPEERARVEELRQKAIANRTKPIQELVQMTAPMAAIFFSEHSHHNRSWDPPWSNDIGRVMLAGDWRTTSQGYGLLGDDGSLGDGTHRCGAQGYTGIDLAVWIYLGMAKEDQAALDCGKRRTAADAAMLAGVVDAKAKGELLSTIWAYEKSVGIGQPVNPVNVKAVANEIKALDGLLGRALEIGETSQIDAIEPLLVKGPAAKLAGILLRHSWPDARVVERLDEVQTEDFDSEKDPLYAARKLIVDNRAPTEAIAKAKEVGIVIKAMLMAEAGILTNPKRIAEIKNAIKNPPDPTYPAKGFGTSPSPAGAAADDD